MTVTSDRSRVSELGAIDYALGLVGPALALYAAGRSIGKPEVGNVLAALAVGGTLLSWMLSRILPPKIKAMDGAIYAVLAILSIVFSRSLNESLPDRGFPFQLFIAAILSFIIVFGSVATWRDSTLLFQAIPSMALFGLVGTVDVYRGAVFAFFVYLICLATAFSRAHTRAMYRQAEDSGYRWLDALKKGPWRWMAGPEWALGSAAVVVLLSLIGAPMLQSSVQGVSGFVKVNLPPPPTNTAPSMLGSSASETAPIGRGPISFTQRPALRVLLDEPRYLRGSTFMHYNGRGWDRVAPAFRNQEASAPSTLQGRPPGARFMRNPQQLNWGIEILNGFFESLPAPGEPSNIEGASERRLGFRPDGTVSIQGGVTATPFIRARSFVSNPAIQSERVVGPENLPMAMQTVFSTENLTEEVYNFARQVTRDATNDYERAMAIKMAIERQVKYNLNAPAVPGNRDPVEFFLFESKEGYCDLFASAMVAMARSVGLPARYVTGFYPNFDQRDETGMLVVRDSDAHAWAEILFEDVGWVVFDATEGAESVPGSERGAKPAGPWWESDTFRRIIDVSLGVVAFGGIGFVALLAWRSRDPRRRVLEPAGRTYQRFERVLEKASGMPRLMHETPKEYVDKIAPRIQADLSEIEAINAQIESWLYSEKAWTPEQQAALDSQIGELSRQLRERRKRN
ncbi:MAG: transglutaminaseTgpA domain-containing protein [Fimbriimonadaceae bacterium]